MQYVPQVTRPVSGRTATRTQGCLTLVCSAPRKRSLKARLPAAARALACHTPPGCRLSPPVWSGRPVTAAWPGGD